MNKKVTFSNAKGEQVEPTQIMTLEEAQAIAEGLYGISREKAADLLFMLIGAYKSDLIFDQDGGSEAIAAERFFNTVSKFHEGMK
jgi:hypothetical protein